MTIRVLVADDQPLMRAAFEMTLRPEEDVELVGEAADGYEALEQARRLHPDVILMDVRMPRMDGVEATRSLTNEGLATRILILTTFDIDEYVIEAIRAGASGFLLKDVRPAELVEAIRIVANGDALLAPSATRRLLDVIAVSLPAPSSARNERLRSLTPTELKVLTLVGTGASNDEISAELFVADTTVRTHVRHILEKLSLRDRVQAVVLAHDLGLVRAGAAPRF
jgi:DNA-binding NarL/FixJ family response regulator